MAALDKVLEAAMKLEVRDRAMLAEQLLASLDELDEKEASQLWAEEAQRRLDGFRSGTAKTVDADTVHEEAERLYA